LTVADEKKGNPFTVLQTGMAIPSANTVSLLLDLLRKGVMMKWLTILLHKASERPFMEGLAAGIELGERSELGRVSQVLRDEFADLPVYAYAVSKPVELGEYLVEKITEGHGR
jgi:hypothetical protein